MLDSGTEGPGFKSHSRRCRVTVLGKLFTPIVPLFTVHQAAKLVATLLRDAGVTAGLAESNGSLYRRVYDSHRLQADCQEPGSAPEPYARLSSMGYLYLLFTLPLRLMLSYVCAHAVLFADPRLIGTFELSHCNLFHAACV